MRPQQRATGVGQIVTRDVRDTGGEGAPVIGRVNRVAVASPVPQVYGAVEVFDPERPGREMQNRVAGVTPPDPARIRRPRRGGTPPRTEVAGRFRGPPRSCPRYSFATMSPRCRSPRTRSRLRPGRRPPGRPVSAPRPAGRIRGMRVHRRPRRSPPPNSLPARHRRARTALPGRIRRPRVRRGRAARYHRPSRAMSGRALASSSQDRGVPPKSAALPGRSPHPRRNPATVPIRPPNRTQPAYRPADPTPPTPTRAHPVIPPPRSEPDRRRPHPPHP